MFQQRMEHSPSQISISFACNCLRNYHVVNIKHLLLLLKSNQIILKTFSWLKKV